MSEYTTTIMAYCDLSPDTLKQLFQLRREQFIDRLKWNIESYEGGDEEADNFDAMGTYYLILEHRGCLVGSVRLRPSFLPNMTNTDFSELVKGIKINRFTAWEASRFHIANNTANENKAAKGESFISEKTVILFLAMIEYGIENSIEGYEIIVDAFMKRLLSLTGWKGKYLASGKGSCNETIYYGFLPCSVKALTEIAGKYYSYGARPSQLEAGR
jgi:acyl homoserine lactone synthase